MTPTTPNTPDTNMNGCTVLVTTKDAVYVRLPEGLRRSLGDTPCTCGNCDGSGLMDTLVVPTAGGRYEYTHMVHLPTNAVQGVRDYFRKKGTLVA